MKAQRTKDDFGMTNSISGSGYVDLNANVLFPANGGPFGKRAVQRDCTSGPIIANACRRV